jgi:hypothetical protein
MAAGPRITPQQKIPTMATMSALRAPESSVGAAGQPPYA